MDVPTLSITPDSTGFKSHKLPQELLYQVLTLVMTDSVHSICMSPEDVEWELNVTSTLCRVCLTFRDITTELAVKAFDLERHESIFHLVYEDLQRLRILGLRLHHPSKDAVSCELLNGSPLLLGYSSFLSVMDTRYKTACSVAQFRRMHGALLAGFLAIMETCRFVEPIELADALYDATLNETILTRNALTIVEACLRLHDCVTAIIIPLELETSTQIHEELVKIEFVKQYTQVFKHLHVASQLPSVISALQKLHHLQLDVDEFGIRSRAGSLLEHWSTNTLLSEDSNY